MQSAQIHLPWEENSVSGGQMRSENVKCDIDPMDDVVNKMKAVWCGVNMIVP